MSDNRYKAECALAYALWDSRNSSKMDMDEFESYREEAANLITVMEMRPSKERGKIADAITSNILETRLDRAKGIANRLLEQVDITVREITEVEVLDKTACMKIEDWIWDKGDSRVASEVMEEMGYTRNADK